MLPLAPKRHVHVDVSVALAGIPAGRSNDTLIESGAGRHLNVEAAENLIHQEVRGVEDRAEDLLVRASLISGRRRPWVICPLMRHAPARAHP